VTGPIQRRKKTSARDRWLVQIMQDPEISDSTRVLLMHLGYRHMDAGGRVAGATHKQLARELGWTDERAAKRVLERLTAAKTRGHLIKDDASGFRGRPAIYFAVLWPGKGPAGPDPLDGERVRSKRGKSGSAEPDPFSGADGRKGPAGPDTQRARVTGRESLTAPAPLRDSRPAGGGAAPPPAPPGASSPLRCDEGEREENQSRFSVTSTRSVERGGVGGPRPPTRLTTTAGDGPPPTRLSPPADGRADHRGALVGDGTNAGARERERFARELAAAAQCPHGRDLHTEGCDACLADALGCAPATLTAAAEETDPR
jgi:hypothetical protein